MFDVPSRAPIDVAVASAKRAFSILVLRPLEEASTDAASSSVKIPDFLPAPRNVPMVSKVSVREKAKIVVRVMSSLSPENNPLKFSCMNVGARLGILNMSAVNFGTMVTPNKIPINVVPTIPIRIALCTLNRRRTIVKISPISATCATGSVKVEIAGIISL